MSKLNDILTKAEKLSNGVSGNNSGFNEYNTYKSELKKKVLLSNDNDLNVKVADAVDKVFDSSALDMTDANKEIFKSDVYEVIIDNNISNEIVLYSVIFAMLLKYYNLDMANADRCRDTIYQVCDNMAKLIAQKICN